MLRVEAEGEPAVVAACSCRECQRRTGSVLGVGAYYPSERIRVSGESKVFTRLGVSGMKLEFHFCPGCGTSLYWEAEFLSGHIGVAVGAFADPQFPAPTISVWEESKHPWLSFTHNLDHSPRNPTVEEALQRTQILSRST
jgi:hypothetical protein